MAGDARRWLRLDFALILTILPAKSGLAGARAFWRVPRAASLKDVSPWPRPPRSRYDPVARKHVEFKETKIK
jgi:hypothetical protein